MCSCSDDDTDMSNVYCLYNGSCWISTIYLKNINAELKLKYQFSHVHNKLDILGNPLVFIYLGIGRARPKFDLGSCRGLKSTSLSF